MNALARATSGSAWTVHAGAEGPDGSGPLRAVTALAPVAPIAGKYLLRAVIGEGGMGAVWSAHNVRLDMPVAIKLLHPGLRTDELAERLRFEGRTAARLEHPNVVRVLDAGETEAGDPFLVMELLRGESLGAALARGPLRAIEAVQLLLPIADALVLAHSLGVVHRDLKPDNIFLACQSGSIQPKLLDFGIAQTAHSVAAATPNSDSDPPRRASLLGSPQYMSPEQVRGDDTDERTDVWSFCVVLYEALSGRRPFSATGRGCNQILSGILSDTPLPLEVFARVDPELSRIVQRGLAKARDERYRSIFELRQALAGWLAQRGVQERESAHAHAHAVGSLDYPELGAGPDPCAMPFVEFVPRARERRRAGTPERGASARPGSTLGLRPTERREQQPEVIEEKP